MLQNIQMRTGQTNMKTNMFGRHIFLEGGELCNEMEK